MSLENQDYVETVLLNIADQLMDMRYLMFSNKCRHPEQMDGIVRGIELWSSRIKEENFVYFNDKKLNHIKACRKINGILEHILNSKLIQNEYRNKLQEMKLQIEAFVVMFEISKII